MKTNHRIGSYNVICDRCGFKLDAGQTRMEWQGLRVCKSCWEPRHPQDFVRGRVDKQRVPNPRPDPTPIYLTTNEITSDDL